MPITTRMSLLVDELLLLTELDAGPAAAREPVDFTRLAIDATSDAQVAVQDHRWLLELPDEPVMVLGDEHRLHQVLADLLSNAAKHTPPGTTVTVALALALESCPGKGCTAQLGVADDGSGIPPDLQSTLFERFVRAASSRSRAAGSTGLCLAIVMPSRPRTAAAWISPAGSGDSFVITPPALTRPALSPRPGSPVAKQTSARPALRFIAIAESDHSLAAAPLIIVGA